MACGNEKYFGSEEIDHKKNSGTLIALSCLVFHRILDFIKGCIFMPALFFVVEHRPDFREKNAKEFTCMPLRK
jgi:hypothetical protein